MQHQIFEPNGVRGEPIPANGYVRLRIEKVSAMESERKYSIKTVISHFNWELMVRKSFPMISDRMYKEAEGRKKLEALARQAVNAGPALRRQMQNDRALANFLDEGVEEEVGPSPRGAKPAEAKEQLIDDIKPQPFLSLHLACAEQKERQNGWNCKANIELTVSSANKERSWFFHEVNFSEDQQDVLNRTFTRIPWDELMAEYIGGGNGTEENGQDWLQICASLNIVEQNGYGLLPIKDILIVNDCQFQVNKAYLAAFSNFFRTMFFSPAANNAGILGGNNDGGEHQITDPTDNMEAFKLMLKIAHTNGTQPNDELIVDLLHLADKYDLPNVTEHGEKFLLEKSKLPKIQKLGLADQYNLANLKKHSIQQIEPVDFCEQLSESVNIYNELSQPTRQELNARMKGHKRRVRFIDIGPDPEDEREDQPGPSAAKQARLRVRSHSRPHTATAHIAAFSPPSSPLICIERAERPDMERGPLRPVPDCALRPRHIIDPRRNAEILAALRARQEQFSAALNANRPPPPPPQ